MFIYYITDSGFVIPKSMIEKRLNENQKNDENGINNRTAAEESIHEKRKKEKQKRLDELKNKAEQRKEDKNQLGFFDS